MPHLPPEVITVRRAARDGRRLPFAAALALAIASAALSPARGAAAPPRSPDARTFTPWDQPPPPRPETTPELLALGGRVFKGACLGCHGEAGDGEGREGRYLPIPPRDFVTAQFICRHTPGGTLPRDEDLFRAVRKGFKSQVGMPSFRFLSDREVWAVIAHIKTFSTRWTEEELQPAMVVPPPPRFDAEGVKRGQALYVKAGCVKCHGDKGRGDGPSSRQLTYDNEKPVVPADFAKQADFKCGPRPQDVFRTLTTGMDGTPMPSFSDNTTDAERWDLVQFVLSVQAATEAAQASAR
jgi:mono/diheme cytochrome c family protein